MELKFYLSNGTISSILPEDSTMFYVMEIPNSDSHHPNYGFEGDHIRYDADSVCVDLYDVFQDKIFPSREEYYRYLDQQPQWIMNGGLDSDNDISKTTLSRYFDQHLVDTYRVEESSDDNSLHEFICGVDMRKYRYAYLADCQNLIGSIQELIQGSYGSFVGFYKMLCSVPATVGIGQDYCGCSTESRLAFSMLYSIFIQIYSVFDLLTKMAYELENIQDCTGSYKRLSSKNVLFGDRNRIMAINKSGTVFESNRIISIFENMRNELIHNAVLETNPKVFFRMNGDNVEDRCIYMPDFTEEGTIIAYRNRKRFFSEGKTVNRELPIMYISIMRTICATLEALRNAHSYNSNAPI